MNVEAISSSAPAISVGIEAPASAMPAPSFGTEIGAINGGTHSPDLNSGLFSQTSELKIGSIDSFDKVVPGNLAFTHTEALWQASRVPASPVAQAERPYIGLPSIHTLENVLDRFEAKGTFQANEPEITISEQAGNILDSYVASLDVSEPNTEDIRTNKEFIVDAEQAAVVKDAWIAIGASEDDATESVVNALGDKIQKQDITEVSQDISNPSVILANEAASDAADARPESRKDTRDAGQASMTVLEGDVIRYESEDKNLLSDKEEDTEENTNVEEKVETVQSVEPEIQIQEEQKHEEKQGLEKKSEIPSPVQQNESFFEEDSKADAARKEIAVEAIEKISRNVVNGKVQKISGGDIAQEIPNNPQPHDAISEIIKKSRKNDGSYVEMTEQIAKAGDIQNTDEAKKIIEKAIGENPAVRVTSVKTSRSVTETDVQKVLRGETVLFEKR
ncbi:MAG: hypothetical protein ACD_50C00007G0014 [uncultured bacterium]|nr:MAG: hypothetical protein ACD_50C00007G0014 [uncultured bacterium]